MFLTDSESIQNYIDLLQVIFTTERERAEECFDPTTLPLLISQLEHVMIRVHLQYLAQVSNNFYNVSGTESKQGLDLIALLVHDILLTFPNDSVFVRTNLCFMFHRMRTV